MTEAFKKAREQYIRFIEKQGFPIIVTVCVAVITATALFTMQSRTSYVSPTPPPVEHISAAQLLQQSLANAATATPAPTATPLQWCAPLDTMEVLRSFDVSSMICMDSGVWAIHDAIDLKTEAGAPVYAISDGEVIAAGNDMLKGAWLTIRHDDRVEAHYAGLALLNDYISGDTVYMGDTIGFCGNGPLDEESSGPHLHLRVTKDGQAIDPNTLWLYGDDEQVSTNR